ncbi:hypothetical protein HDE_08401 [Halotydeus destructor]|nr:hypothetical protein HDE_08401 [Halotydeus destructor]
MGFNSDRMPKTYRVGRIVVSTMTAAMAFFGVSNIWLQLCIATLDEFHATRAATIGLSTCQVLIAICGLYGAINHHIIALLMYAGFEFLISILIPTFVPSDTGVHVFFFIWWNATFSLLPAYLAHCIRNADQLMMIPMLEQSS